MTCLDGDCTEKVWTTTNPANNKAGWIGIKESILNLIPLGYTKTATSIVVEFSKDDKTGYAASNARSAILHDSSQGYRHPRGGGGIAK